MTNQELAHVLDAAGVEPSQTSWLDVPNGQGGTSNELCVNMAGLIRLMEYSPKPEARQLAMWLRNSAPTAKIPARFYTPELAPMVRPIDEMRAINRAKGK